MRLLAVAHKAGGLGALQHHPEGQLLRRRTGVLQLVDTRAAHDLSHDLPGVDHPGKPDGQRGAPAVHDRVAGTGPTTWLCYNPGDPRNNLDDNCSGVVDDNASPGALQCVNGACVP